LTCSFCEHLIESPNTLDRLLSNRIGFDYCCSSSLDRFHIRYQSVALFLERLQLLIYELLVGRCKAVQQHAYSCCDLADPLFAKLQLISRFIAWFQAALDNRSQQLLTTLSDEPGDRRTDTSQYGVFNRLSGNGGFLTHRGPFRPVAPASVVIRLDRTAVLSTFAFGGRDSTVRVPTTRALNEPAQQIPRGFAPSGAIRGCVVRFPSAAIRWACDLTNVRQLMGRSGEGWIPCSLSTLAIVLRATR